MACVRQSRPDYGIGCNVKLAETLEVLPVSACKLFLFPPGQAGCLQATSRVATSGGATRDKREGVARPQNSKPESLNPELRDPTPSTLNPQPSTLNPAPYTLNPEPYTLNPEP